MQLKFGNPTSNPILMEAAISDLFFHYAHPAATQPETLPERANEFAMTLAIGTGIRVEPAELVYDFSQRLG